MKQTLKYIYSNIQEQLKFSEQKHSIIIAINSGLIVLVTGIFDRSNIILLIENWLIYFCCGLSIVCNFMALFSKTIFLKNDSHKFIDKNHINLLYYKDLLNLNENELLNEVKNKYSFPANYLFDGLEYDLAKQIIVNSIVVNRKYKLFNMSILFLTIGVIANII